MRKSLDSGPKMRDDEEQKKSVEGALQPPDGGWGWMVVFGSAISQMFVVPILQNFTLIFKDRFVELHFSSADITTLVSLNASFGMILGLLNGPLLKIFGYRKVALVGLTLYIIGIFFTGIAKSYIEFIVFYGLLSSLGMAMEMASFSLAINSYFLKNRSKAISYTMTLTNLGPIMLPFVTSYLLSSYGLKWTVFFLSGLSLHAYIGGLLLQPVKWHMKYRRQDFPFEDKEETKILLSDEHSFLEMSVASHSPEAQLKLRKVHSRELLQVKEEQIKSRRLSVTSLDNEDYKNMMNSTLQMIERIEVCEKSVKYASEETLSLENGEYVKNFEKNISEALNSKSEGKESQARNTMLGLLLRFIRNVGDLYDLDLLHDPYYINIMLGLSVAFVGEVIFSTMTPIILQEVGFSTEDTATFMSVIAGCNLFCRFIAPFVGKKLKLSSKKMYLIALFLLLTSRASMFLTSTYEACLLVSFGLGIGKGFRSVFWVLVLPDYVPLRKLASASAFQSLVNGILILASGPLIGAVINLTNSYLNIIIASNILTLTTILLWCVEILYLKIKKKGNLEKY